MAAIDSADSNTPRKTPKKTSLQVLAAVPHVSFLRHEQRVFLVGETKDYRNFARHVPITTTTTTALEVGCAYGDCTNILAKRFEGRVTGVDVSSTAAAEAAAKFERLSPAEDGTLRVMGGVDVFSREGAAVVRALANPPEEPFPSRHPNATAAGSSSPPLSSSGKRRRCSLCMVDIGGDRDAEAVVRLVGSDILGDPATGGGPATLVIKCRLLYKEARKALLRARESAAEGNNEGGEDGDADAAGDRLAWESALLSEWWRGIVARERSEGSTGLGLPHWQRRQAAARSSSSSSSNGPGPGRRARKQAHFRRERE